MKTTAGVLIGLIAATHGVEFPLLEASGAAHGDLLLVLNGSFAPKAARGLLVQNRSLILLGGPTPHSLHSYNNTLPEYATGSSNVGVALASFGGDDKQSLRLAAALGSPFDEKQIVFNDRARTWRLMLGPSLSTVDDARSSALEAPWPDLVISSGWRQVPVVRWIKARSKGQARLVQMNRPPGARHFDLVLSPPQFQVPDRPNIVRLDWPLQLPPDTSRRARAASEWKERLAPYPHPWTVVLVGGSSHPFGLDRETAQQLFDETSSRAQRQGGSLMISTSRRTPVAALGALDAER